ncbi:solute carrier family 41 member 1-like [Bacillus rossius redtenbacheri]|uniref:solute carrier family 41 member 1-like n=1 Tax=Bacillus rossius redtenbacheri TaxID=93214 RepID=UPI002FDED24E
MTEPVEVNEKKDRVNDRGGHSAGGRLCPVALDNLKVSNKDHQTGPWSRKEIALERPLCRRPCVPMVDAAGPEDCTGTSGFLVPFPTARPRTQRTRRAVSESPEADPPQRRCDPAAAEQPEMVAFPDPAKEEEASGVYRIAGLPVLVAPYLGPDAAKAPGPQLTPAGSFVALIAPPRDADEEAPQPSPQPPPPAGEERWFHIALQVAVPFVLGGMGTIAAGVILGVVEKWEVFSDIRALFILVPALQGLKGNLDTCLASRLSTQANKGNMVSLREVKKLVIGNIALVQVQAIVAAIVVSIFALSVTAVMSGEFKPNDALLLSAASLMTATSSCFFLDLVLISVIIVSYRNKMNPDNVATPFAASIGDVICLTLFSQIATLLYGIHDTHWWILATVIGSYLVVLPFWIWVVLRNDYTRPVLKSGWVPVLSALFISGMGGLVLDEVVDKFKGYVVFQPIVNGIGGNLVSVQASRISTYLHVTKPSQMGFIPPQTRLWASPWAALFKGLPSARTARILIAMAVLGQSLFVIIADLIHSSTFTIQAPFFFTYLVVSTLQVTILLYVAHHVVHLMWKLKTDPDNSSIPYLTALGDLIGSCLLGLGFLFLQTIHCEYSG